jgi:hypothetical protein
MHLRGVVAVLFLSSCASSSAPTVKITSTPARPSASITVPADVREELSTGLPVALDLHEQASASKKAVATCTVMFDLWDEVYVVNRPGGGISRSGEVADALVACLGTPPATALVARVAPPPPADPLKRRREPVF